jgi:ketosteroid isomerase-like protein
MSTRQIVRAYHEARFSGDIATATACLGPGFTFTSPLMTADATGHLATLNGFLQIVTGVDLISELYGDAEATLVYNVHTATPVGVQHTAEHFTLANDRITAISLIFDATGWHSMLAVVQP